MEIKTVTESEVVGDEEKNVADISMAGTASKPYRLCIVGGGPAGYSILIRAIRIGVMDELCEESNSSNYGSEGGICLLDSDKQCRLGGGRLQDYSISSNTWGNKFYSNVIDEKEESLPAESIKGTALEGLASEGAYFSPAGKKLVEGGPKEAPLKTVGKFLVDVAASVHKALLAYPKSSCIKSECKVVRIERFKLLPPIEQSDPKSRGRGEVGNQRPASMWKVVYDNQKTGETDEIYCKKVALATGGKQFIPDLTSKSLNAKVLGSDHVCTEAGISDLRKMLLKSGGSLEKKRIVIVGGSHSAFSAAWMCLNQLGLTKEQTLKHGMLGNSSVVIVHRSAIRVFYATKREADQDEYEDIGIINKTTGQIHPFGGLRGDSKRLWKDIRAGRELRVRLVRSPGANFTAKLYDEAAVIVWACGYETNRVPILDINARPIELRTEQGQVAVDEEARLSTSEYHADISYQCQNPLGHSSLSDSINNDRVVTKAADTSPEAGRGSGEGGKETKEAEVMEENENEKEKGKGNEKGMKAYAGAEQQSSLRAGREKGNVTHSVRGSRDKWSDKQLESSLKLWPNLAADNSLSFFPVDGLLGLGLGYGLRATLNSSSVLDGSSGRADGVAVYMKRAATLVLADVLGDRVFGVRPAGFSQADAHDTKSDIATLAAPGYCSSPNCRNASPASCKDDTALHMSPFISSWDERASILNEMKRREQKLLRESIELEERSGRDKERELRRDAKQEIDNAGSISNHNHRKSDMMLSASADSKIESKLVSKSESKPLRFPAIGSGKDAPTSEEEPRHSAASTEKKPRQEAREKGKNKDKDKDKAFCALAGGSGSLSLDAVYTMSSEFQKRLNKSLDATRLSSCVDRLSRPKALTLGHSCGDGTYITEIPSLKVGTQISSSKTKGLTGCRRKTTTSVVSSSADITNSASTKKDRGRGSVPKSVGVLKHAWSERKDDPDSTKDHSGGSEESKVGSPQSRSLSCTISGDGCEACSSVPLSPIKPTNQPSPSSVSLLYSPMVASGSNSNCIQDLSREAVLGTGVRLANSRGALLRGPLAITRNGSSGSPSASSPSASSPSARAFDGRVLMSLRTTSPNKDSN